MELASLLESFRFFPITSPYEWQTLECVSDCYIRLQLKQITFFTMGWRIQLNFTQRLNCLYENSSMLFVELHPS